MKLIVNIPAYNEAKRIKSTIEAIPRRFPGVDQVLVQVIDDGSADQTAEVARQAGADIVVRHSVNRRLGEVFNTAIDSALSHQADIMVNIDADGQFDAEEIGEMIKPIIEGRADITIGDRFRRGKAKNIPLTKKILNKLAAKIVGRFLNKDIHDLTCGFRAHGREALLRLNKVSGFTYTQETIIDAIGKNLRLQWIPITVHYFSGRKSRVVKTVWSFVNNSAKVIIKAMRDVRPMKFFGIPGFLLIFLSFFTFVVFLSLYLPDLKITPYRNHLLLSIAFFLVGLQFIILALMADMIKASRKLTEDLLYQERLKQYNNDQS